MRRIALVNQRFGLEVNGGSEYYTRILAERLVKYYDVEVLTTCALDYITWENEYPEGFQLVGGIRTRRFLVDEPRNLNRFADLDMLLMQEPYHDKFLEKVWTDLQGPLSSGLVQYIKQHKKDYDVFIFVTYSYYHTIKGLPLVAKKSILIPTAHDEHQIYFQIFKKLFHLPKAFLFLTEEEKDLVHRLFNNQNIKFEVAGVGMDNISTGDLHGFKNKYGLEHPYLIYVGRIDQSKGCPEMFSNFFDFKKQYPETELELVLMGKKSINIPESSQIRYLGFVDEKDKYTGILGAEALVLPSPFESLSLSVLEALALGTPVIVNGKCQVLKGHCEKSQGGIYYLEKEDFIRSVYNLVSDEDRRKRLSENAKMYIENFYQWKEIMERICSLIEFVAK